MMMHTFCDVVAVSGRSATMMSSRAFASRERSRTPSTSSTVIRVASYIVSCGGGDPSGIGRTDQKAVLITSAISMALTLAWLAVTMIIRASASGDSGWPAGSASPR